MTVRAMVAELRKEPFWAGCSDRMVWLACRYYAGIDSLDDLRRCARRVPISGDFTLAPTLTVEQVETIIRLR
jgi:hypothetical protein